MSHALLKEIGLSEKETRLYLANLALGTASITQLAKKANLKRPTAYLVIDQLLKENLLIAVPQGKKFYYKAQDPEQLYEQLDRKRILLRQILPDLKTLYATSSKHPQITHYEGKDKLHLVYEQIFKVKEIWALFSVENFLKVFSEKDNRHFFRILVRYGGIIHDLVEDTKKSRQFMRAPYRTAVSNVKFLPTGNEIDTDILIYDGKVALVSFSNLTVTIIDDESIAITLRTALRLIWNAI